MSFSRPGAFDLSSLAQPTTPEQAPAEGQTWAIDATAESFQQVAIDASLEHVVVLSLWSPRSAASADFTTLLSRIVDTYGGRISLVRLDVDAAPQVGQALGVQQVPFVAGLIKGQPVPLFQSTVDEPTVRATFDQLLQVAVQNGLTGRAPLATAGAELEADPEPEADPRFAAADEALAAGDLPTTIAEYQKLAAQYPADDEIKERLAGVQLMERTRGVDLTEARQAAADRPDDIDAQLLVADLDVSGGHIDDAFGRLIDLIRVTQDADRERVRTRLIDLFTVVGATDPRVASARRALATALY